MSCFAGRRRGRERQGTFVRVAGLGRVDVVGEELDDVDKEALVVRTKTADHQESQSTPLRPPGRCHSLLLFITVAVGHDSLAVLVLVSATGCLVDDVCSQ